MPPPLPVLPTLFASSDSLDGVGDIDPIEPLYPLSAKSRSYIITEASFIIIIFVIRHLQVLYYALNKSVKV